MHPVFIMAVNVLDVMDGVRKAVPIGVDDFMKIREGGYCYVDKSELISDIVEQRAEVYLFTRPRRFGKSLNLSMMQRFFDIRDKGNSWFDGLNVMDRPDAVAMMSTRPVVRIDMKGLPTDDYDLFLSKFSVMVLQMFLRYGYLGGSERVDPALREIYARGKTQDLNEAELLDSLRLLCTMLHAHHGIEPIVLIDEYDNPTNNAHGKITYDRIIGFLRLFYSAALKGNDDLGFAVVTGVMQIAKESIFSGLNNLYTNNIFSKDYDERYGFTPSEVQELCEEYGNPDAFPVAKEWYDGYRFGNAEIYNPWSVLNFIQSGFVAETYWAGTSSNDIIETLLDGADDDTYGELQDLGNGGTVADKDVTPSVVVADLDLDPDAIYSVLAMTGYLNAVPDGDGYALSVPNREMYEVFSRTIVTRGTSVSFKVFKGFFDAAERNDTAGMERYAFRIFAGSIPDWDLPDEGAYRRILVGAAMCRNGRYTVTTEAQSGNGRSDMIMTRNIPAAPNIVMEFKKTRSEDTADLQADAEEGLRQIKDREYFLDLKGRTIIYGIAFANKRAKVVSEVLELRWYGPACACAVRTGAHDSSFGEYRYSHHLAVDRWPYQPTFRVSAMRRKDKSKTTKSETERYDELDAAIAHILHLEQRDANGVIILPDDWDDLKDVIYDDYRV